MIVALYILLALVFVGALLWLHERRYRRRRAANPEKFAEEEAAQAATVADDEDSECCGMHMTCEKDSLLAAVSEEIVYFDDEELDAYRGRSPQDYSDDEIEQFRDVLLTLLPDDIAPWARSLQLRGIELPADVRDELLLIVSEARARRAANDLSDATTT